MRDIFLQSPAMTTYLNPCKTLSNIGSEQGPSGPYSEFTLLHPARGMRWRSSTSRKMNGRYRIAQRRLDSLSGWKHWMLSIMRTWGSSQSHGEIFISVVVSFLFSPIITLEDSFLSGKATVLIFPLLSKTLFDFLNYNGNLPFPKAHIQSVSKQLFQALFCEY